MMSIVINVSFVFLKSVECVKWVGFVVNHTKVEQLSVKSKKIKHEMYRTADFLSTIEVKKIRPFCALFC